MGLCNSEGPGLECVKLEGDAVSAIRFGKVYSFSCRFCTVGGLVFASTAPHSTPPSVPSPLLSVPSLLASPSPPSQKLTSNS